MPGPIRTALKVDLKQAAAEQPYLHVSISGEAFSPRMLTIVIESMASR
jgi:hypothetical protein